MAKELKIKVHAQKLCLTHMLKNYGHQPFILFDLSVLTSRYLDPGAFKQSVKVFRLTGPKEKFGDTALPFAQLATPVQICQRKDWKKAMQNLGTFKFL